MTIFNIYKNIRADSEADSEGGGVKRAYKNTNKRKTIRKLKLSKSRKHSNSS